MAVENLSISLAAELADAVRAAASRDGVGVSEWLARLAARELHQSRIRAALEAFATEHEPLSEAEVHDLVRPPKRAIS